MLKTLVIAQTDWNLFRSFWHWKKVVRPITKSIIASMIVSQANAAGAR